jgi:hypothetical protein
MLINISAGIHHYSADEIIGWANSGILYCGEVDLSGLVGRLLEDRDNTNKVYKYTQEDLDDERSEGYSEGISACMGALDNL